MRPLRLTCDNFTPPTRTPWGGRRILSLKADLDVASDKVAYAAVGESWELSVDPTFPSHIVDGQGVAGSLIDAIGPTRMLVKLLDTADELSVQVHPPDDYPGLASGESGKPECWYIIDREPGAGIYLGLAEGVDRETLSRALAAGDDVSSLLNFVPVESGDCFVIGPGTVHAIGRGVLLVEPQLVRPRMRGMTYRLWDWNRRYDAAGRRDPAGHPRALQVAEGLAVTRFDAGRGAAFVESARRRPTIIEAHGGARRELLVTLDGMQVERFTGPGRLRVRQTGRGISGLFVLSGHLAVQAHGATTEARRGETLVLPVGLGDHVMVMSPDALVIATRDDLPSR